MALEAGTGIIVLGNGKVGAVRFWKVARAPRINQEELTNVLKSESYLAPACCAARDIIVVHID